MVYKPVTSWRPEWRISAIGLGLAPVSRMLRKLARLFTIKNRFEACAIIYALAVGAVTRGLVYLETYPGWFGLLLFAACTGAVFMAGAKIFDATRPARHRRASLARVVARARAS
jgi:hypothetical protein